MANSSTLTSSVERRNVEPNIKQVWERVITYLVEADGGATEMKEVIPINGILQKIIVKVGDAAGVSATVNVAIDDNGDNEIFAVTGLAENSTYKYDVNEPVSGSIDVGMNPSDDPAAGNIDWPVVVTLRGI